MSKFVCKCGHVINFSHGWSDCELALLPEQRIEQIGDLLNGDSQVTDDRFYDLIDEVKITAYRCPTCGRLHLESKDAKNHFTSYIPEP